MANKKSENKNKTYTLNRKRFLLFISVFVILICVVIIALSLNKKIDINDATDISKLNANKHYKQISELYNNNDSKNKFLDSYNDIQNAVVIYIINNSTKDENSFKNLVDDVNNKLNNRDFSSFNINYPNFWNGNWSIDTYKWSNN